MRPIIVGVLALSFVTMSCGSSPAGIDVGYACSDLVNAEGLLSANALPCEGDAGTVDGGMSIAAITPTTSSSCTGSFSIGNCTSADLTALEGEASCFNGVAACNPANPSAFTAAVTACQPSLSSSCATTFGY